MKLIFSCVFICFTFSLFSQAVSEVPLESPLDISPESTTAIQIPLYQITLDNISIPIIIEYQNTGIKTSDIPTPLGLNWSLKNIGKITRTLNHLPDDLQYSPTEKASIIASSNPSTASEHANINGWIFSSENTPFSHLGLLVPENTNNYSIGVFLLKYVDSAPDYFSFDAVEGIGATFLYKKNFNGNSLENPLPLFLNRSEHLNITTNFDKFNYGSSNYNDIVFEISRQSGTKYSFIGGPNKQTIARSDSNSNFHKYKDYYVKNIQFSTCDDVVDIDYIENINAIYTNLRSGIIWTNNMYLANVDQQNDAFASNSTLEVKEITTPKEVVKFLYINKTIGVTALTNQIVKQLAEIQILNKENEYITGYTFEYIDFDDNRFTLSKIYQHGTNKIESKLFRDFQYYPDSPGNASSLDIDMLGYSTRNNITQHAFPYAAGYCGAPTIYPAADRRPHENWLISCGMLHTITNPLGGIVEYKYKLKSDGTYYGGGLVVSEIISTDHQGEIKTTTFTYSNLKGLVIPIENYKPYFTQYFAVGNFAKVSDRLLRDLHDTDPLDFNQDYAHFSTQKFGSYFMNVTQKTLTKQNTDPNPAESSFNEYFLTTYEYSPSYEGIVRKGLLTKKSTWKVQDHFTVEYPVAIPITEENHTYGLRSTNLILASSMIHTQLAYACPPSSSRNEIIIEGKALNVLQHPLDQSVIKTFNSINDPLGIYQPYVARKSFSYIGEQAGIYDFDKLRIKQIQTFENEILIGVKNFQYLFEVFDSNPNAGLTELNAFSTPDRSLISQHDEWVIDPFNGLVLKEAFFIQYFSDGKIKEMSKSRKNHATNLFYTPQSFTPFYSNGMLTGVSLENKIRCVYDDLNGKLVRVVDLERQIFESYFRGNNKDPYTVNSILTGSLLSNQVLFYRNSFEGNQPTINITSADNAYTGNKVFTGSHLSVGNFPSGSEVSFWYYKDSKWQESNTSHISGNVIINRPFGALYMDEVQIKPPNTKLNCSTTNSFMGINDFIDDSGFVMRSYLDPFGKIIKQVDQDQNLLQKIEYNFINE